NERPDSRGRCRAVAVSRCSNTTADPVPVLDDPGLVLGDRREFRPDHCAIRADDLAPRADPAGFHPGCSPTTNAATSCLPPEPALWKQKKIRPIILRQSLS